MIETTPVRATTNVGSQNYVPHEQRLTEVPMRKLVVLVVVNTGVDEKEGKHLLERRDGHTTVEVDVQDDEEEQDEPDEDDDREDEQPDVPDVPQEFMFDVDATPMDPDLIEFANRQKSGAGGGRGLIFSQDRGRYIKPMLPRGNVVRLAGKHNLSGRSFEVCTNLYIFSDTIHIYLSSRRYAPCIGSLPKVQKRACHRNQERRPRCVHRELRCPHQEDGP